MNGGYRLQIHQRTTTRLYNNAKKVQDSGFCKALCTRNGKHNQTLHCGFMAYLGVARQFLVLLSLKTWRRSSPQRRFCTSTSTLAMIASKPWIVWCGPLSSSSTVGVRMHGSNWIRYSPPVKMENVNQHMSCFVRFSCR